LCRAARSVRKLCEEGEAIQQIAREGHLQHLPRYPM
jgi:hypothetical protein